MSYTVECVPNFSEGRDAGKVQAIHEAVVDGPQVASLDVTMDPDHNRSVITFAGTPEGVQEAALRAIGRAAALIDLNLHDGVHPRIGSTDVLPIIPLAGSSLTECTRAAEFVAAEAWTRYGVPTYLYGAAARRRDRSNLESIRRGGFEGLRNAVKVDPDRHPDFGGAALHPTAGATAVGARDFLIAFNVNLNTSNAEIAKAVAQKIRSSSGGLPCVKALGLYLPSRNLAQVSMNLTDFKRTSLAAAFDAVEREAEALDAAILESELVGLIPRAALDGAPLGRMKLRSFTPDAILENRLARAAAR
ncbi:MAG: glutamate formimidoyltransferase [Terriglobia bacterium]